MNTITIDEHTPPLLRPQVPNLVRAAQIAELFMSNVEELQLSDATVPEAQSLAWYGVGLVEFLIGKRAVNYRYIDNATRIYFDRDSQRIDPELLWDRLQGAGLLAFGPECVSLQYHSHCLFHEEHKQLLMPEKHLLWQDALIIAGMTVETQRVAYEMAVEYAHASARYAGELAAPSVGFTLWPYRAVVKSAEPMMVCATHGTPDYGYINEVPTYLKVRDWWARSFPRWQPASSKWIEDYGYRRLVRLIVRANFEKYETPNVQKLHHAQLKCLTLGLFLSRHNNHIHICIPVLTR